MNRQPLTTSHIIVPSSQNPKQSRLYVKQQEIKRKVSKIQTREQLQKVYKAMKSQNTQLVKDVTVLKQHLAQVEEKKKLLQSSRVSVKGEKALGMVSGVQLDLSIYPPQMVAQYDKQKKSLDEQYKLMQYLKSTLSQLQKQTPTQQVTEHRLHKKNQLKQVQTDILNQKKQLKLLIKQAEQLQLTMKQNQANDNVNGESIKLYEQENSELRKKISQFRQEGYKNEYKAVSVIDEIYKKKHILTQYQSQKGNTLLNAKVSIDASTKQDKPFFNRTKSVTTTNLPIDNHLSNEVTQLKQQVQQLSIDELKRKEQQKKQKQQLIDSTKKINDKLKQLERIKTKKAVELNHLKAKVQIMAKQKELREKNKIITSNFGLQQDGFSLQMIAQPLRRDFIGIIGQKSRFDDRMFLRQKKRTFIKGLIIYQNDNNLSPKGSIAAIRAIYTDAQTNSLNFVPLPGQYLQKCKTQRLELPEDDFLKLIKVKYNNLQTRVTKLQIRSNRNLKYEFGEKRAFQEVGQNESVYAFDIGLNEFPVGLFGSFCQLRSCWFLEAIGVEINKLS